MARRGREREGEERGRRSSRQTEAQQREKQIALWIALGVGGLFVMIVVLIVISSSGPSPASAPSTGPVTYVIPPPPPKPGPQLSTRGVAYALRTAAPVEKKAPRTPSRGSYHDRLERTYEAAKRRADNYANEGRWGKAIQAIEGASDEFDELRFRTSDLLDEYREKARVAFRTAKLESDKLYEAGKFDAAMKLLKDAVDKGGTEREQGEAKRKIEEIGKRKTEEAQATFERDMAGLAQQIVDWDFDGALDKATKLHYGEPDHQQALDARVERIRFLIDLRKKMCEKISTAMPKLSRRAMRVPGGVDGDLMEADAKRVVAESPKGNEDIPWTKFGGEATMNVAVAVGRRDDGSHRIAVAKLLMEVGYYDKAKIQLTAAKKLGADPTAEEAELQRRTDALDKAKEKAEEPKADEPKAEPKGEPKGETKGEPKAADK